MIDALAVFDIGKTNIKLSLVDAQGRELAVRRRPNEVARHGLYPHHDVDAIETWLLAKLRELAQLAHISAIVPVTHGATAALVDEHELVLPIMDYEQALPLATLAPMQYEALRPPFSATCSPALGLGLNLGRQLHWQQQAYPEAFARARHLLMYPQYWAWRLSGVAAAEVTSLGCHTDLWQPSTARYSSLVERCGWQALMPPLQSAWSTLGNLRPALALGTGLPEDCQILCGVHDSNASLLRYLERDQDSPRVVLSTGTWIIAAALDAPFDRLREECDMLTNVNVLNQPVACMRFMGGREFGELAGAAPEVCSSDDLQALIDSGSMALPSFASCGGPFFGRHGSLAGAAPTSAAGRYALASLYCALMTDYCLQQLQATGGIVVEGSFTTNPHFAALLSALDEQRSVYCSQDSSGTTTGGWMLRHWHDPHTRTRLNQPVLVPPAQLRGWKEYRQAWRNAVNDMLEPAPTI